MRRTFACLVAGLALFLVHASGAWAADKTLDLKVLVISTGPASVDPGLDLMDDVLNEVGVPYDVLDSSTDVLTPGRLSAGDHGFYNGVILTNSELFLPDGTGSGFSFLEWDVLHAFERDFGVRESVLSGFPATNPGLGLDYGMTDIIAGNDFQGIWQAPAGGTEIFEYVNEANPLPITDFAFAGRPFVIYAGEPSDTGIGPHVQPLLNWRDDLSKTFVSYLRYDDGREVLLSTISNAWFLIHSQVLAYEFLNFATKGVFIGSREVYLESHVDDLFLENELWDPTTNTTDLSRSFRMDAAAVQNTRASVDALRVESLHGLELQGRLRLQRLRRGADLPRAARRAPRLGRRHVRAPERPERELRDEDRGRGADPDRRLQADVPALRRGRPRRLDRGEGDADALHRRQRRDQREDLRRHQLVGRGPRRLAERNVGQPQDRDPLDGRRRRLQRVEPASPSGCATSATSRSTSRRSSRAGSPAPPTTG